MTQSIPTHQFALPSPPATGEGCSPPFSPALHSRYRYGPLTATETVAVACTASELVTGR